MLKWTGEHSSHHLDSAQQRQGGERLPRQQGSGLSTATDLASPFLSREVHDPDAKAQAQLSGT
jgi:hypothetical protein